MFIYSALHIELFTMAFLVSRSGLKNEYSNKKYMCANVFMAKFWIRYSYFSEKILTEMVILNKFAMERSTNVVYRWTEKSGE